MNCYRLNKVCLSRMLVWYDSTLPGPDYASLLGEILAWRGLCHPLDTLRAGGAMSTPA